jgi:hypothetical protein
MNLFSIAAILLAGPILTSPKDAERVRMVPKVPPNRHPIEIVPPPDPVDPPQPVPKEVLIRATSPVDYPHGDQSKSLRLMLAVVNVATTNVTLAWNAPVNSLVPVDSYLVFRGRVEYNYDVSFPFTNTIGTVPRVPGQSNYYTCAAIGTNGAMSKFSNIVNGDSTNLPPVNNFAIITLGSTNKFDWKYVSTATVSNTEPFLFFKQQIIRVVP